jgi:hypothetical protein
MGALVDSNVLLDVLTEDPTWFGWSSAALSAAADRSELAIDPLVDAEVSIGFEQVEDLDDAPHPRRVDLPALPAAVAADRARVAAPTQARWSKPPGGSALPAPSKRTLPAGPASTRPTT